MAKIEVSVTGVSGDSALSSSLNVDRDKIRQISCASEQVFLYRAGKFPKWQKKNARITMGLRLTVNQ